MAEQHQQPPSPLGQQLPVPRGAGLPPSSLCHVTINELNSFNKDSTSWVLFNTNTNTEIPRGFFAVLTCIFHLSNLLSRCAVPLILPWTWVWKMAMLQYTLRGRVCQVSPCWKGFVKPRLILLILTYQGITLTSELTEQSEFSKVMWCWQDVPTLHSLNTSSKSAVDFHPIRKQGARREQGYDTKWRAAISDSTAVVSEISEEQDCQRGQPGWKGWSWTEQWRGIVIFPVQPVSKGSNRGFGCSFAWPWKNGVSTVKSRSLLGTSLNRTKVCEGQDALNPYNACSHSWRDPGCLGGKREDILGEGL